jgi:hypothetical protein
MLWRASCLWWQLAHAEIATFRNLVLHVAARITRGARQVGLRTLAATPENATVVVADPNNPYALPTHFTLRVRVDTTGPVPYLLIQVGGITVADGEMARMPHS